MTDLPVVAYKGFNSDLTCRGFQYAEGKAYAQDEDARLCSTGFHACLDPLDVLTYYHHADGAVYHQVELGADAKRDESSDSKVASKTIKIGAKIDIFGMVKVHFRAVWDRVNTAKAEAESRARTALESGAEAASSGDQSTAASSGDRSTAASSGDRSTAASSGDRSTAASSGYQSTAASSGDQSTVKVTGAESIAVAGGYACQASGVDGCWLVLAERDNEGRILDVKSVRVGGKSGGRRIKPGVLYMLVDGKVTEVTP